MMVVITAEALDQMLANVGVPVNPPRKRKVLPNIPVGSVKAKTPYYREAEKTALGRRPVKALPRRSVPPPPPAGENLGPPHEIYTLVSSTPKRPEDPEDPEAPKHNILYFNPPNRDSKIDIKTFARPIKLNRKPYKSLLYADADTADVQPGKLTPQLGPDGNPVYHNGEVVMVNAEGQTTISAAKNKAPKAVKGKGKASDPAPTPKKKANNKPKTRQIFKAPDAERQKRKEESVDWLLEDAVREEDPERKAQRWVGKMTDTNNNGIYALFKFCGDGQVEFIPVHRFYNFQTAGQTAAHMRAEDAHAAFTSGKKIDLASGFAKRGGGKASEATMRTLAKAEKMEVDELKPRLKRERPDSDDEGGRDEMDDLFDEVDYDEQVADDDDGDGRDDMAEDEDEKVTKQRLQREWASAKVGEKAGFEDEDEDMDFEDALLNVDGKRLKNALKKSGEYESDESDSDDDYYSREYGSKKEEEDDIDLPMATGVQEQARPGAKTLATAAPAVAPTAPIIPAATAALAKATSINAISPTTKSPLKAIAALDRAAAPKVAGAGTALVAKRATSPPRRPGAGSPLSRATSLAARATSPLAVEAARAPSPVTAQPKAKKVKFNSNIMVAPSSSNGAGPSTAPKQSNVSLPTKRAVVDFIRAAGGQVPVNELAAKFRTKDGAEIKKALIQLVKEVGKMAGKQEGKPDMVALKPEFL